MKIAMLCRYCPPDAIGGGENYFFEVFKGAKKDFDVSLISGWKKDKKLLPKDACTIDMRSKNSLLNYWRFYSKAKKYLKKINPDLVFATCYEFPSLGKPTVITVCHLGHLMGKAEGGFGSSIKKRFSIRKFKKADRIIAISKSTRNDLILLGIDGKKIDMAYPGIDVDKFVPKKTKNERFTIVYPSRISPEKAQHIAIEALEKLPKKILEKIRLQLVGFVNDEKYLDKLRDMMKGLPVEILTNVPKIEKYVVDSDLVIFPTMMWEGFGIVAGEALAASKPLIATGYPAVKEVMGKHGIAIKPGDSDALAKNIELLYSDSKEIKKLTKGARDWILSNFNWENMYKVHKKVFEEVIKG